MMTEVNEHKPVKTNDFAIASLVLAILWFSSCGLTAIPGFICGIISVIQIRRSKRSLTGWLLSVSGLVINAFLLVIFFNIFIWGTPGDKDRKTGFCSVRMQSVGMALQMYAYDNNLNLPPSDKWVDLARPYIHYDEDIVFTCPSTRTEKTGYAINNSISSIDENQFSDITRTVLLFESIPGDNPHGGPELLPLHERHILFTRSDFPLDDTIELPDKDARYVKVNNICFADGHVKSVTRGKVHTLIWDSVKKTSSKANNIKDTK